MCWFILLEKAMTVQAKPAVEGEDNFAVTEDQYDEEETFESVLGKWLLYNFESNLMKTNSWKHFQLNLTDLRVGHVKVCYCGVGEQF